MQDQEHPEDVTHDHRCQRASWEGAGRRCSILDCELVVGDGSEGFSPRVAATRVRHGGRPQENDVAITLGSQREGSVERVLISQADSMKLLAGLAVLLRDDQHPPKIAYGTRRWLCRNSVARAEVQVQDRESAERTWERTRRDLPDVASFVGEHLQTLARVLAKRGYGAAKPETVIERVRRAMLVVIEAVRADR